MECFGAVDVEPFYDAGGGVKQRLEGVVGVIEHKFHVGPAPRIADLRLVTVVAGRGGLRRSHGIVARAELDHLHAVSAKLKRMRRDEIVVGGKVGGQRSYRAERVEAGGRRQALNLPPGSGHVCRCDQPPRLRHQHERLVAELVDQPRHPVGRLEDGVVAARGEEPVPGEARGPRLAAKVGHRLSMVERLQVSADGDPLGEALHP